MRGHSSGGRWPEKRVYKVINPCPTCCTPFIHLHKDPRRCIMKRKHLSWIVTFPIWRPCRHICNSALGSCVAEDQDSAVPTCSINSACLIQTASHHSRALTGWAAQRDTPHSVKLSKRNEQAHTGQKNRRKFN